MSKNRFQNQLKQSPESGAMSISMALTIIAVATVGIIQLVNSSNQMTKSSKRLERAESAKQLPQSAAAIAKALLSLPPHVEIDKAKQWTTAEISRSNGANLPLIYPSPYFIAGAKSQVDSTKTLNVSIPQTSYDNLNWKPKSTRESGNVFLVYTNDGARASADAMGNVFENPANLVNRNETISRTSSEVIYQLRNCDNLGRDAANWTGIYCASAEVSSDNYATGKTASTKKNRGIVQLGIIPPPPAPSCLNVTTNLDASKAIAPGDTVKINIKAGGVIVGYDITFAVENQGIHIESTGSTPVATKWDNILAVETNTITFSTKSIAKKMTSGKQFNIITTLKGVNGSATPCNAKPSLKINSGSWYASSGQSCNNFCSNKKMNNRPSPVYGNYCLSGEVRGDAPSGMSYPYGTWGGGLEFRGATSDGDRCYGARPGKDQPHDNDPTDITVACYCEPK